MLLESLIVYACLEGKGCSDSTSAYYSYNKDVQAVSKRVENYGKQIIEGREYLVCVMTPMYAAATGKKAEFLIHRNLYLQIEFKQPGVGLKWSY